MSLNQLSLTKTQQSGLFVGALITSFLGGLFLLIDDFAGWYNYSPRIYGWIGISSAIENGDLIGIMVFAGFAGALFFGTAVSLVGLLKPDFPSLSLLVILGMLLAAVTAAVSLIGGGVFLFEMLADEPTEWWYGLAFWGSLIGGALTALFFLISTIQK
ncbi:MAG: hypothetical protein ACXAC8_09330 [Candidatus Hodarchaeales archaeon]|jgi:hypothetical protein